MLSADDLDRYRTFWLRFGASLIDGAVIGPIGILSVFAAGYAPTSLAIAVAILVAPAGWAYTSYCHGRWGMTLGKRAVGIVVLRADNGGPVGYRRAILRDLGTVLFSGIATLLLVVEIQNGDTDQYRVLDVHRYQVKQQPGREPSVGELTKPARDAFKPSRLLQVGVAWCWSLAELLTMLSNARRRAIHDFIGGTVVVKVNPRGHGPPGGPSARGAPSSGPL